MDTAVHLTLYAPSNGPSHPVCEVPGFLIGPAGQLWDLCPRLGYGPRLLAYGAEGVLVASDAESADGAVRHPATPPWIPSIEGHEAQAAFMCNHDGRYLALTYTRLVDGHLKAGPRRSIDKRARLELRGNKGSQSNNLVVCEREQGLLSILSQTADGAQWLGGALQGDFLLLHARSVDAQGLLDFANLFVLPGAPRGFAPRFAAPIPTGPRSRLSPLAARSTSPLAARVMPLPAVPIFSL